MSKEETLLHEIAFKTLPLLKDPVMQRAILLLSSSYPGSVDVENLMEHSLAHSGDYEFVDETGRDFNNINNSDSKTGSISPNTCTAEIKGLETKIGSIMIQLFNPLSIIEPVSFLYIPTDWVRVLEKKCYGKSKGKTRFQIRWNPKRPKKYPDPAYQGYFNQFEKFRVRTFEELSQMTDEKFYQLHPKLRRSVSPSQHSLEDSKIDSIQEISIPCNQSTLGFEIQHLPELRPSVLSVKS